MGLPLHAEVVVIGGGVMGTSTLWHLARLGVTDTLLVERDTIASGSTSKAAGGFRAQFSDELNIRIGLEAIGKLERFHEEPGFDIDLKQWGYLFLLDEGSLESFRGAVDLQNRLGVPSRLLTVDEALGMVPGLSPRGLAGAAFSPSDGYATPEAVAQGYAAAARSAGAKVVQGLAVEAIEVNTGRVTGVTTAAGRVATPVVVLCGGIWSRELSAPLGLDLPVVPEKRHVFLSEPDPLVRRLPLVIDFAAGFWFHREGDRLVMGGREQTLEEFAPVALQRLPMLGDLEVRHSWWGWYGMSPDHNAIVGRAREPDGLLYATGFSGHGFQQGPVVGEYLAALAIEATPPLDLSPLSVERFATRSLRPERNVV